MPYVYVLRSHSTGRFYVGSALELKRRLSEHERKHSPYTRSRGPWVLVYQEEFPNLGEARRRERQIKNWKSHRAIEEMVQASQLLERPDEIGKVSRLSS